MLQVHRVARAALLALASNLAFAQQANDAATPAPADTPALEASAPVAAAGTLVFEVLPFRSEITLKPKVENQLKTGGIEWGVKGGQLVVTMVNKRFIDFDIAHMTRYGQSETLSLPAGEYRITGVGLEMHTAFSVEKILAKGGYVNEDVIAFTIEPGKTTKVTIDPVIQKDNTFFVQWFMPALSTTITPEGGSATPARVINQREAASIAWPQYQGKLKFRAQ